MKTVLKVALGVVVGLFVLAFIAGIIGALVDNDKATNEVADATAQVVIDVPASVKWKGAIGGVEQSGQGPATLDVPNTGSGKAKEFKAAVRKTTAGKDLLTVILNVDGKEVVRESNRDFESEIQVSSTLSLK